MDAEVLHRLLSERIGRTTLITNRLDWSAAWVARAYNGQQHAERVFRGGWGGYGVVDS